MEEKLHKVKVAPTGGEVTVSVAGPARSPVAVIIAHGAAGDMNSPLLVDLQRRLAARSMAAVRFNFLYTEDRRTSPDRQPHLEACWHSVADWVRQEMAPEILFLGGKSMGGRIASHLAADGYACQGLFFLGYPLHPAGKPAELRKAHLPRIRVPMLFISGTHDALCDLRLLRPVLDELGSRASLHLIEGGDHSFKVPKRLGRTEAEVTEEIADVLLRWLDSVVEES